MQCFVLPSDLTSDARDYPTPQVPSPNQVSILVPHLRRLCTTALVLLHLVEG